VSSVLTNINITFHALQKMWRGYESLYWKNRLLCLSLNFKVWNRSQKECEIFLDENQRNGKLYIEKTQKLFQHFLSEFSMNNFPINGRIMDWKHVDKLLSCKRSKGGKYTQWSFLLISMTSFLLKNGTKKYVFLCFSILLLWTHLHAFIILFYCQNEMSRKNAFQQIC
jgi:hypothetical protein